MKYLDNPHANAVVVQTAQLWQLIPTSSEMGKAVELKPTTIEQLRSVTNATWILTRERTYLSLNGLICGKKPIEKPSAGCLKMTT